MTTRNIGSEGFRWFVGVVEDREDPLKLGRLRVRIYNVHSPKQTRVPTDTLPWASVMMPVSGANYNKIGQAPVGIQIGTTVIGFFMDGDDGNTPVIMGSLAGIPEMNINNHDVPPEAREINLVNKQPLGPEPASAYRAKYPYNKVLRTEGGHVIEIDDTPNFERIHIYHKSGTYIEIDETGRFTIKIEGNDFEVVAGNKELYVKGNVNVKVDGTYTVESSGNMRFKAPKIDLN